MDQQDIPHSNKKVIFFAIGAIGLVFLCLFLAILTIGSGTRNTSQAVSDEKSEQSESEKTPANNSQKQPDSSEAAPPDGWKTYKNEKFSIDHPINWQVRDLVLSGGGTGVSIKPIVNTVNTNFVLSVENAAAAQQLKARIGNYRSLGFVTSTVTINNLSGTKVSGSLPPKSATASASIDVMQTTTIILDKGANSYVIDLSYISTQIDQELEKIFTQMIDSLKIL